VAALQHNQIQPTIFWFDAHGDFNTRETSCTGYLGGMSLAILGGRTEQGYLTEIGAQAVPENSAVLVDGRRLDPKEAANLSQSQVKHVPIDGIGATLDEVENPVYLHIDVDVINPNEMPGMLYDAYYGPSMIQVIEAAKQILSKTFVCAISIGLTLSNDRREAMRAVAAADVLKKALTSQLEETNHRPPNTQRREKCKYLKTMMPT
jgi:arginase